MSGKLFSLYKKYKKPKLKLVSEDNNNVESAFLGSIPELKRYILNILPSAQQTSELDDILQEVFLRAYSAKKKETLQHGRAYLFRIARNVSFNRYNKHKKNVEVVVEDFVEEGIIDDIGSQEDVLIQNERLKLLNDAMASLPPKCRKVFFLRHFEGMSHREIGAAENISTSTVEKHLAKALFITMREMSKQEDQATTAAASIRRFDSKD